jgi:hypothetical protein
MTGHPEDTTARSRQVQAILHDYLLALVPDQRSCCLTPAGLSGQ